MGKKPSLYEILGIPTGATEVDIKKAYYKLSKVTHPDKTGGNAEEFKKICHAYEVLSCPNKRKSYDESGSENGEPNLSDIFGGMGHPFGGMGFGGMFGGAMFGGGGGGGMARKASRGPDITQDITLSLVDFYNGREIQHKFQQQRTCIACKSFKTDTCSRCRGQGIHMVTRHIGPNMIQQSTQKCTDCNGEGTRTSLVCKECSGKKFVASEKILNICVVSGMSNGEQIRFTGECSESIEYERPGDMIINLKRTGSIDLDWQGNDLRLTHTVDMAGALLGFSMCVAKHPSGKDIHLSWVGGPLQHGTILVAKNLGMPIRGKKGVYGNLHVYINIISEHKTWTTEQYTSLQRVFPQWKSPCTTGVPLLFQ
jgi:DnaJ family protein A protein 2